MTHPIEKVLDQVFGQESTIHLLKSRVDDTYLVDIVGRHVNVARCAGIPQVFLASQLDEMLVRASAVGYGFEIVE
jgi:hypothetical protein